MRLLSKYAHPFVFSVLFLLGIFFFIDGSNGLGATIVSAQANDVLGVEAFDDSTVLSGGGESGFIGIVARIINIFLGLLGVIAVGLMIYAGVVWMSSAGDETKIATAKKILINATIGLAIILSSWAITSFVLNRLGLASGVLEDSNVSVDDSGGVFGDCVGFCGFPGNETERCTEDIFVVKSLSPNTENTGMNNVSVRAVFSQPIESSEKGRAVKIVPAGLVVNENSTFDSTLPRTIVEVKTREYHQANNGDGWFKYCGDCFGNNDPQQIEIVDDPVRGSVTHLNFGANAGLQKDTNLGLVSGGVYELRVIYKVEEGRLLVRVGDNDSNGAYENVSGALTDTNGEWQMFAKRFTYDPEDDPSLARIVLHGIVGAENRLSAFVDRVGIYPVEEAEELTPESVELGEGNRVLTLHFSDLTNTCVRGATRSCVSEGGYTIRVAEDLESAAGRSIQIRSDVAGCEDLSFPLSADFTIQNNNSVDLVEPKISGITFKQDGLEVPAHMLRENNIYTVHAEFADRQANQGGVGLVTYNISGEGVQARTVRDGMSVADGSDGPYSVSSTLHFGALRGGDPDQYTIEIAGFDIDNNPTSAAHIFTVQGGSCDNGVLDEGEILVDEGGVCASNGACLVNADCRSGLCVDGECKSDKPMIVDVYPQTWAGAPGNIITLAGSGFGEDEGRVIFSYTNDQGNTISVDAGAACAESPAGGDFWSDTAVVVAVPAGLPEDSLSSIRIEREDYDSTSADHDYKFDTSTDNHGPRRGNVDAQGFGGYFLQNNEVAPSLCAIVSQENQALAIEDGLINQQVVILGQNFGNEQGVLNFGAVAGGFASWEDGNIQSRVPNMPRQQVYVFVRSADGAQSNALAFRINTEEISNPPEITTVEGVPTTNGSLITIKGRHFGTAGRVFLGLDAVIDGCLAGNTDGCIELKVEGIEGCDDVVTWSDQQIVAEVVNMQEAGPVIAAGNYRIGVLRTSQGLRGSNTDQAVEVTNADAKPSLCGVSPSVGPAPNGDITLFGKNLSDSDIVYYFKRGALVEVEGARNVIQNGTFSNELMFWSVNEAAAELEISDDRRLAVTAAVGFDEVTLSYNQPIPNLVAGETYRISFDFSSDDGASIIPRLDGQDFPPTDDVGVYSETVTLPDGFVGDDLVLRIVRGSISIDNISLKKETGLETWLSSDVDEYNNQPVSRVVNGTGTEMETEIPEDDSRYSMITGPIRVLSEDGELSNSVQYSVQNCLEEGFAVPEGMVCCPEGDDAGLLRPADALCAGEVREAGYVWRFNTGLIPVIPRVLEQCNDSIITRVEEQDGGEEPPARLTPSPSPSRLLTRNQLACPNSNVIVLFNTPMNNIPFDAVTVRSCGEEDEPNCQGGAEVPNNPEDFGNNEEPIMLYVAKGGLAPSTWHEVVLDVTQITSVDRNIPLRSGGEDGCPENSYCFRFKTDNEACQLTGAFVRPSQYTAEHFGVIQNPSFPRDEQRIDTPPNPYIFSVLGLTNKSCLTMDVGDRAWQWGSDDVASAEIARDDFNLDPDKTAVKTKAAKDRVNITASLGGGLEITSEPLRLKIEPETPRIIDYWPNCTESCSNASIGMVFNRRMLDLNVNNIRLEQCDSSVCENPGPSLPIDQIGEPQSETVGIRVRPQDLLLAGGYYKVTVTEAQPVNGYNNDTPVPGQVMDDFSWIFRVRGEDAIEAFCAPDSININPSVYIAREVGERNMYTALPFSVADECSREGQELDPFDYGWEWRSRDRSVAEVTSFSSPISPNPSCTNQCLKTGSDILRIDGFGMSDIPLCGNREIDHGEDCDIALEGETPGVSCGFDCLRPGNTAEEGCGNGQVEENLGEECDDPDSVYCSDTCLNTGTEQLPLVMVEGQSYCGSRDVGPGPGEDCDGGPGCSISCLHEGTALSALWCGGEGNNIRFPVPCQNAVTVCGNGVTEHNEECDDDGDDNSGECTDQCVYGDLIGSNNNEYYQDPETEGATRFATRAGSSVLYSVPSFCGDSVVGIGEDPDCETLVGAINPLGQNPVQLATAIGDGVMDENNEMSTAMEATALSYVDAEGNTQRINIPGSGEYTLQCGYAERNNPSDTSIIPITTQNNCPNNENNTKGVGNSTCCSDRPAIATHYPDANQVCLNTALHITFDEVIAEESITPNAFTLLRGSNNGCEDGEQEVDEEDMDRLLAMALPKETPKQQGFFRKTWEAITGFFRGLFFDDVLAINQRLTWCKVNTTLTPEVQYFFDGDILKTRIHLAMNQLLNENTAYAVHVSGGVDGLKNEQGVGLRSRDLRDGVYITSDIFSFVTGDEVCKIDNALVDPDSHTYTAPNTRQGFTIIAQSHNNQELQTIPDVYDWTYRWGPRTSQVYTIPQELAYDTPVGYVSSTAVEGAEFLVGSVDITTDNTDSPTVGDTFAGLAELTSFFCENPWPSRDDMPYNDQRYNFSFYYCADAGLSGERVDDLPFLGGEPTIIVDSPVQPENQGLLYKVIFPSDKNEDAIGVQVFQNPNASSTRQWLDFYFPGTVDNMQPVSISGYGGFTNGHTYYVAARNMANRDTLYNNIYSFTINRDAQENTKQVFAQIIDNLELNSNLSNVNLCLAEGENDAEGTMFDLSQDPNTEVVDISCSTDFDCRDAYGNNLSGTNGVCFSARDKMARDIDRLGSLKNLENSIERYRAERGQYPQIVGGTFVAQYTNSRWPSWNILSQMIGGAQIDPINAWTQCSRCNGGLSYGENNGQIVQKYGNLCVLRVACGVDDTTQSCQDAINNAGAATFDEEDSELFGAVFSCAMQANSCGDAARCYDIEPEVNTRCGLRNYESGDFLCAENQEGVLVWLKNIGRACNEADRCAVGLSCDDGTCQEGNSLSANNDPCQTNDECQSGHCATLLGGGEGLCVERNQCIKTNGGGLVVIGSGQSADGQFMCDNGELVINQNNNQISDAKEMAYQGAVACQSDLQCPGPLNSCEDLDQQTCWDAANTTVHCPALSHMFEYESLGANAYKIHAPLEFFSGEQATRMPDAAGDVGFGLSDSFETTLWCAEPRGGEGGSVCGDGIVSVDEECDIASYQRGTRRFNCAEGQVRTRYCSNECIVEQTECGISATCGDGVLDAGEQCDDGVNNGRYGSLCADDCTRRNNAGYCGDGQLQSEHEFCDIDDDGVCSYYREGVGPLAPILYFVVDRSLSMDKGVVSGSYNLIQLGDTTEMTRWTALTRAIEDVFGEIGGRANGDPAKPKISLIGFSDRIEPQNRIKLAPGFYDQGRLNTAFDDIGNPRGGTPLAETLRYLRCGDYGTNTVAEDCDTLPAQSIFRFNNEQDALRPKKMILFVDGDDNSGDDSSGEAYSVTYELTKLLNLPEPIETYVVGVGNEVAAFSEWASAGGTREYIPSTDAAEITNAINSIRSCSRDYSIRNGNSCSADCQDFGGYCGDGIIQRSQGEQCDDGNYISDDGCNIYCKTAAVAEVVEEINGSCGDGVVQTPNNQGIDEVCDLGEQNGIACDPEYGESCTYCSHDCRENLTVDPIAQCGDGKIDFVREGTAGEYVRSISGSEINFDVLNNIEEQDPVPVYEVCDVNNVNQKVLGHKLFLPIKQDVAVAGRIMSRFILGGVSDISPEEHSPLEDNDPNDIYGETQEWSCDEFYRSHWDVYDEDDPRIAVGELACSNTCDSLTIGCHVCGDVTDSIPPYTDNERAVAKVMFHNALTAFADTWLPNFARPSIFYREYGTTIINGNPTRVLQTESGYSGQSIDTVEYQFLKENGDILQLGSHPLCSPFYSVQLEGDAFPFSVNGERNEVHHDLIVVNTPPADHARVVISSDVGVDNYFFGNSLIDGVRYAFFETLVNNPRNICDSLEFDESAYARPSGCNTEEGLVFSDVIRNSPTNQTAYKDHVIQTTTFNLEQDRGVIPFYVSQVSRTNFFETSLINQGREKVRVSLYLHDTDKSPSGYYKPDYVFRMNLAEGSSNLGARYWHVFNLVFNDTTGEYEVQEANKDGELILATPGTGYTSHDGSIETDYADVLCNVPEQACVRAR